MAPRAGQHLDVCRDGKWKESNRYSAVVRVQMAGKTILIGGDAPLRTWSEIPEDLNAEVFRVPHHGGALMDGGVPEGWTATRLYKEVNPRLAALSVGTNNAPDHPVHEWVEPLLGRDGCRLLCTQVTGRCHPAFGRDKPDKERRKSIEDARTHLPAPYRDADHFSEPPWRHYVRRTNDTTAPTAKLRGDLLEVPCAGTISVRIDEHGDIEVDPASSHASLATRIGRWSNPMCRH